MNALAPILSVILFFLSTNSELLSQEPIQEEKHAVSLSKSELDANITYFLSKDLFNNKKFTIKGFKVKINDEPIAISKEIAFGNNLKYILKQKEIGTKISIYDIEYFMFENEKIINRPSEGKILLEVILKE